MTGVEGRCAVTVLGEGKVSPKTVLLVEWMKSTLYPTTLSVCWHTDQLSDSVCLRLAVVPAQRPCALSTASVPWLALARQRMRTVWWGHPAGAVLQTILYRRKP